MDKLERLQLIDSVVTAFQGVIERQKQQIKALNESKNLTILDEIDASEDYADGTLSNHRSGTFVRENGGWRCIANNIHDIHARKSGKNMVLILTMSDGSIKELPVALPAGRGTTVRVVEAA